LVKDPAVHIDVIKSLSEFFLDSSFVPQDLSFSPITGASSKNIEYLIHLKYKKSAETDFNFEKWKQKIEETAAAAHKKLGV